MSGRIPGVRIVELPISGAFQQLSGTGVRIIAGKFPSGTENELNTVYSWDQFYALYGGLVKGSAAYRVWRSFAQGAGKFYVVRVKGDNATITAKDRQVVPADKMKIEALVDGVHGNLEVDGLEPTAGIRVTVADGTLTDTFKVTVSYWEPMRGAAKLMTEGPFDNLSPDPAAGRYFVTIVNAASKVVKLTDLAPTSIGATNRPAADDYDCASGAEPDYVGDTTPYGIDVFQSAKDAKICLADSSDSAVVLALIAHCTLMKNRICVLDPSQYLSVADALDLGDTYDSDRALLPYPYVSASDPVTDEERDFSPDGDVAGALAALEPWKSPSQFKLLGLTGTERELTEGDSSEMQDLQDHKLMPISRFLTLGVMIRNGINLSSDANLSQVCRRRMMDYCAELMLVNAQPYVSLPINDDTNQMVTAALSGPFEDLKNRKPMGWLESYTVICNGSNNTDNTKAARKRVVTAKVKLWNVVDEIEIGLEVGESVVITNS